MLQASVDVRLNVTDVILQTVGSVRKFLFHTTNCMHDGGVILTEFFCDVGVGEIRQLADEIHGNLTSLCSALIFLRTTQNALFQGVETADLRNDQIAGALLLYISLMAREMEGISIGIPFNSW